jgi:phosphotriesterase-related protein
VFATGLHSLRPVPYFHRSTETELARLFTAELIVGAAGTTMRPAVVKTGVGGDVMTDYERKVVGAAATAALDAHAAIAVHVEEGGGRDAVDLLLERGVAPHRILVAHVDSTSDTTYHRELAEAGVMLGFDRFGNTRYQSDDVRMANLLALVDAGHTNQLLISQDYPVVLLGREGIRRDADPSLAEWTPTHLVERVLPRLRDIGLSLATERQLTHANPGLWLVG